MITAWHGYLEYLAYGLGQAPFPEFIVSRRAEMPGETR